MDRSIDRSAHQLTHRMLYVTMLLTSLLSLTSRAVSAPPGQRSHLLFYLKVEEELVPQTQHLAKRARDILFSQCQEIDKTASFCMSEADQLPIIPAIDDFPSRKALQKEGSKVFIKHLFKEAYLSLYKLQRLLESENGGVRPLTQLTAQMDTTRLQLKTEMETFFRMKVRDRAYAGLKNSKMYYTRKTRSGEKACEAPEDCLTERDFRLRLLYTAYQRLLRINHVLTYVVRLSWLAVGDERWQGR